jgi:Outer membrane lipoprotein-sorting protein
MKTKLLLILFAVTVIINAQVKPEEVLSRLQNKFNSINDLTADFKQSSASAEMKGGLSGKFYYKKKDQFRMELKSIIIACDGKTTWNYNLKQKKYIVNNYDASDPTNLSLNRFVYDYPAKCKVTIAGKETLTGSECIVIELIPKKGDLNFKKAKIWKDNSDLIKRILFEDQNGTVSVFDLSNIKINQKLADSKFTLTPPEGSKIIDLR